MDIEDKINTGLSTVKNFLPAIKDWNTAIAISQRKEDVKYLKENLVAVKRVIESLIKATDDLKKQLETKKLSGCKTTARKTTRKTKRA